MSKYIWKIWQAVTPTWCWIDYDSNHSNLISFWEFPSFAIKCTEMMYLTAASLFSHITNKMGTEGARSSCDFSKQASRNRTAMWSYNNHNNNGSITTTMIMPEAPVKCFGNFLCTLDLSIFFDIWKYFY